MGYLHYLWSGPLMIAVCVALLVRLLGWPALAGLALMLLMLPLNTTISKRREGVKGAIRALQSQRSNLLGEILQGIRVIKYFAWEPAFLARVCGVRAEELRQVRRDAAWGIGSAVLWAGSPTLVALAAFSAFALSGQELLPSVAFTALALFNVLRLPMATLPTAINYFLECRTSLRRLQRFLSADEVDPGYYSNAEPAAAAGGEAAPEPAHAPGPAGGPALVISDGCFCWVKAPEQGAFRLRGINLRVERGELVMIVGPVGSGKSSLLAAVLAELNKLSGTVALQGTVAYAAQQPWILNATVHDNVLLGRLQEEEDGPREPEHPGPRGVGAKPPFPSLYSRALAACALSRDLASLPAGDATEIGERGVNLSGGQKARVALARACCQVSESPARPIWCARAACRPPPPPLPAGATQGSLSTSEGSRAPTRAALGDLAGRRCPPA